MIFSAKNNVLLNEHILGEWPELLPDLKFELNCRKNVGCNLTNT